MKNSIEQDLRQLVRNCTTVNPKGMSAGEMVDLLVDQAAEMDRRNEYGSGTIHKCLLETCGTCNEFFVYRGKGYRCTCIRYSTHSHHDYTPAQAVKKGLMREAEITPQNILAEIEKAFQVNSLIGRDSIIPYICKALGKPYKKSNYLN